MNNLENRVALVTDLSLHGLILFIFLTCFFILYVSKLTIDAANNQVGRLIDRNLSKIIKENKDKFQGSNTALINLIPYSNLKNAFEKEDIYQTTNNKWLMKNLVTVNILLFMIVFVGIYTVKNICNIKLNISEILIMNLITFIGIGIIEYLFFTRIVLNYTPTTPSLLTETILNTSKNYFSH